MKRTSKISKVFAFLLVVAFAVPARADGGGAVRLVTDFQDVVLSVMKQAKSLGVQGRYDALAPHVEKTFHLPFMARYAVGQAWRGADANQRDRLVAAFRRMSLSTLATLLRGYGGESFEFVAQKEGNQSMILVETKLMRPEGDPVDMTYVTRRMSGEWKIIDVIVAGGISELNVRRSEYRRELREGGVEKLIETLDAKADELLAQ